MWIVILIKKIMYHQCIHLSYTLDVSLIDSLLLFYGTYVKSLALFIIYIIYIKNMYTFKHLFVFSLLSQSSLW